MAGIPGAYQYGQQYAQANQAYQQALARIGQRRSSLLRQYGYDADFDAQGHMSNMRVSANNPGGQLQQMRSRQAHDLDALEDARNASGFRGGFMEQGISRLRQDQGQESAQMGQSLLDQITGLEGDQADAQSTFNDALYQAQLDQARQSIQAGDYGEPDFNDPNNPDLPAETPFRVTPQGAARRVRQALARARQPARPTPARAARVVRQRMANRNHPRPLPRPQPRRGRH